MAGEYVDTDLSASTAGVRRSRYEALLADIEHDQVDAVAYHLDRLTRRAAERERFVTLVEAAGVQVATVAAGELDLSTVSERMTARIVGAVAQAESEQLAERL